MSLKNEVIRVLQERAIQRINFAFNRFRIDASAYRRVIAALERDEIVVACEASPTSTARYIRGDRKLLLWHDADEHRIRLNADSKALIVHECTHAFVHLASRRSLPLVEDEIIAYLAQAIYRLGIQGFSQRGSAVRGGRHSDEVAHHAHTPSGGIFAAAEGIVINHGMLDRSTCTPLSSDDVADLRYAIEHHPLYRTCAVH